MVVLEVNAHYISHMDITDLSIKICELTSFLFWCHVNLILKIFAAIIKLLLFFFVFFFIIVCFVFFFTKINKNELMRATKRAHTHINANTFKTIYICGCMEDTNAFLNIRTKWLRLLSKFDWASTIWRNRFYQRVYVCIVDSC